MASNMFGLAKNLEAIGEVDIRGICEPKLSEKG